MKQNVLAAACSAVLPGAGQLYNHQWLKGAGFLVAVLLLSGFMRHNMHTGESSIPIMLMVIQMFGLLAWSVADAYRFSRSES